MKRADKPSFDGQQTRHVGLQLEAGLYEAVKRLAHATGVSMNFAIRRALIEMVNVGAIPMIGDAREEEAAETTEMPIRQSDASDKLRSMERALESLQREMEGLRASSNAPSSQVPTYNGQRPQSRPKIARTAPLNRVR